MNRDDARHWFARWEAQQDGLIAGREERFATMLAVLDACVDTDRPFVMVDLASGPAGISRRVLERHPSARSVAVELDPVLLAIGRAAHDDLEDRLVWVEHDLRDPAWASAVLDRAGHDQVDAVLTATALHWVPTAALAEVYRACGAMLRPGGVLVNCDSMELDPRSRTLRDAVRSIHAAERDAAVARIDAGAFEGWEQWWTAVAESEALAPLYRERQERFAWRDLDEHRPGYGVHRALLEEAGFDEIETLWQRFDNRVLVALRSSAGPAYYPHR